MNTNLEELLNLPTTQQLDETQQRAVDRCCNTKDRLVAVTGAAGTGKTSLMKAIEKRLTAAGYSVQCSAPTGKASKRIQEATGLMAMTNHRMLGYGMPVDRELTNLSGEKETVRLSTGPRFDKKKRLPYDVLLCDEYAMVNNEIHRNLLDALKVGGAIRMFGDLNQLKPIEDDARLKDKPSCFEQILRKFDGIELMTQHRTGTGSGIAENAARILQGRPVVQRDDFKVVNSSLPVKALTGIVREALDDGIDYSRTDHQIITCMNKSWIGANKLNVILQQLFWNHELRGITLPRWRWQSTSPIQVQVGSKVVYTTNSYDLGNGDYVFNGETGNVTEIDHDTGALEIDFIDRVVSIPPMVSVDTGRGRREFDPRCNIDLAYVLNTHKMQGSECQHAVYVMNRSTLYMQSRRNFYTGVTRARKHCTVITDGMSMSKSLKFAG